MIDEISHNPVGPAVIAFVILIILAAYTKDLFETLSGFVIVFTAFALLYVAWNAHLSTPISLSLAGNGEHKVIHLASEDSPILIGIALFALVVIYRDPVAALTGGIVICAAIVLFPYIYNIFPVPRHQNYYAQVLHELWLPPERIVLKSHQTYFGYLLSADIDWPTVLLLNSRTIVYLHTEDIKRADWNAPTPVGQHFWYYPPSTSQAPRMMRGRGGASPRRRHSRG